MSASIRDYTGDLAAMLHGIFEKNQVHDGVSIVVVTKSLCESSGHGGLTGESIVHLVVEGGDEVGEDKRLRVLLLVELTKLSPGEGLLGEISSESSESFKVLWADQTITVDTLALVSPKLDQVVGLLDGLLTSLQDSLEHVRQMTHVEFVMEVDRGLLE